MAASVGKANAQPYALVMAKRLSLSVRVKNVEIGSSNWSGIVERVMARTRVGVELAPLS